MAAALWKEPCAGALGTKCKKCARIGQDCFKNSIFPGQFRRICSLLSSSCFSQVTNECSCVSIWYKSCRYLRLALVLELKFSTFIVTSSLARVAWVSSKVQMFHLHFYCCSPSVRVCVMTFPQFSQVSHDVSNVHDIPEVAKSTPLCLCPNIPNQGGNCMAIYCIQICTVLYSNFELSFEARCSSGWNLQAPFANCTSGKGIKFTADCCTPKDPFGLSGTLWVWPSKYTGLHVFGTKLERKKDVHCQRVF